MTIDFLAYPILYVDDERENLVALEYALDSRFTVLTARSGEEALVILKRQPIAVLLCDQRMPGMTGVELCQRALEVQPDAARMLITAYSDMEVAMSAINLGHVSRFLLKPWRLEELTQVLETVIEVVHLTRTVRDLETNLLSARPQRASVAANAELIHEIANPLAALTMTVALADEAATRVSAGAPIPSDPAITADIDLLRELHMDLGAAVTQLNAMLKRLRDGVRHESVAGRCDLKLVIDSAVRIVRRAIGLHAKLEASCAPSIELGIDSSVLAEIAINLLMNAGQAIEASGMRDRTIRIHGHKVGGRIVMTVEDDGPGIASEHLGRLFLSSFSTRGDGHGLGLSIVQNLVRHAGGEINVHSELGQGARFDIHLPDDTNRHFMPSPSLLMP